jgi:hypothetical protein
MLSQVLEAPTDIIKKNTKHGLYAGIVLCITSRLAFFGYYKIKRELMNRKLIALDADAILQNEFQTLIRELKEETARLKKSTAHLINSNQKSNEIKQLLTTIDPDRVNQIERVYLCPILKEAMHDPVKTPDGFWFEREAIQKWYDSKSTNRQCIFNPKLTLQNPSELDTDISHQEEIIRVLRQLQKEQSTQSEQVLPRPHNL